MKLLKRIFRFYYEGFKGMTIGRTLWTVILIKLFIMFFVLRLFFFQDYLKSNYKNDEDRAEHVRNELINLK